MNDQRRSGEVSGGDGAGTDSASEVGAATGRRTLTQEFKARPKAPGQVDRTGDGGGAASGGGGGPGAGGAPAGGGAPGAEALPSAEELTAGGEPLPGEVRTRMEQRFGADFSAVRIHTGGQAADRVTQMGAAAFTYQQHIAFAPGAYQPGSPAGDALLAHELTHVVQQRGGGAAGPPQLGDAGGAHEAEADRIGQAAAAAPHLGGGEPPAHHKLKDRLPDLETSEHAAATLGQAPEPAFEVGERADAGRVHRCIPGCTPSKTGGTPTGPAWVAGAHVTPSFPLDLVYGARSNSNPSTQHSYTPTMSGGAAVDAAGGVWRYQVAGAESKGKITIVFFTDDRYPAPTPTDDSGALSNVTSANWRDIVKDLRDNRAGIPDHWSAYRAEILHEKYHWEVEWQGEMKKEFLKAEADIAALSLPFASAATAADAKAALEPQAKALFDAAMARARRAYDALGDSAGDPPYVAQAPACDALRARVEAEAAAKGW